MTYEQFITTEPERQPEHMDAVIIHGLLEAASDLPYGSPETYGPPPLDRMATLLDQINLASAIRERTRRECPKDVPINIVWYVDDTFMRRFHSRSEANEDNYVNALYPKEMFADNPELQEVFLKAELAKASPTELLITRKVRGIRGVALASLTHLYGNGIEMLDDMRSAVQSHVELFGGTYHEDTKTRYRVKEIIGLKNGDASLRRGLLMTRKRTLATLPDGTIIRERSSFVLRTDEASIFTDEDILKLKSVDLSNPRYQDELVAAAQLDETVATLLESNEFSQAIPLATTIYAYNPETAARIRVRDEALRLARREKFLAEAPTLARIMDGSLALPDLPRSETEDISDDKGNTIHFVRSYENEQGATEE